jgi:hypothetical protein
VSGLTKPTILGTAVDPSSPAGVIIDPYTEIAGSPALNDIIKGDGLGGWTVGPIPFPTGALSYQGVWDASANSPALASGVGTAGHYYVVGVAGSTTLDGISDWETTDWAVFNGTVWEKVDNSEANVLLLEFATSLGIPGGGTRYLDREAIACTTTPVRLHAAAVLKGIAVVVDVVDAARAFAVEVVSDPAGVPAVIGSGLALPVSTLSATRRDLAGAIPAGTLWGVRIRRTAGAGGSTFTYARVEVEVKMP